MTQIDKRTILIVDNEPFGIAETTDYLEGLVLTDYQTC